jgi:thiamine-phosphate pyrophosphorylase
MKLVVLTSESAIPEEATALNVLFSNGLMNLHLRKPLFEIEEYKILLDQINPEYYDRIVVHFHHELCGEYGLKGIHLQEKTRINLGDDLPGYISVFKGNGFSVSSSFHEPEEIKQCTTTFDYVFLSPVFDSISKFGYEGKGFNVRQLAATVVGMGGVNENTIQKTFNLGYKGAGVLGGIWNSEDYLHSFKAIKTACEYVVKLKIER